MKFCRTLSMGHGRSFNVAFLVALFVCLRLTMVHGQEASQRSAMRILPFPTDIQVGVVEVFEQSKLDELDSNTSFCRPAYGEVVVPAASFASLTVGAVEELGFLDALPAGALQRLVVRGTTIDEKAMEHIALFEDLRELRIENCQINAEAFDAAPILSRLERMTVDSKDGTKQHLSSLAGWLARLPNIRQLYATPSLDAISIQEVKGAAALESLNFVIDQDRQAVVFKMIENLSALNSLIIDVKGDVSPRSLDRLASVSNLESLTLVGANVDGVLLEKLAANGTIRNLRLLVIKPGSDFHDGLSTIKSLERLDLSTEIWEDRNLELPFFKQLSETLLELPNIKEFPSLSYVSAETLAKILDHQSIETLEIDGLERGVSVQMFEGLNNLKLLKTLRLSYVPVNDDDLQMFNGLESLEYLSLIQSQVRGTGLSHLRHLPNLRRLHIMMDRRRVEPELSGLSTLSHLTRIQVAGIGFEPIDFYPIADCHAIRNLALSHGGLDDSVMSRMSTLPNLRRVFLAETQITDAGISALASNPNLESISLSGDVSAKGVAELSKLKNLTHLFVTSRSLTAEDAKELPEKFPATADIGFRIDEK